MIRGRAGGLIIVLIALLFAAIPLFVTTYKYQGPASSSIAKKVEFSKPRG